MSPISFIICLAFLFVIGVELFGFLIKATTTYSCNNYYFTALVSVTILSIQINRKDKKFIANLMQQPHLLYTIEYTLFTLPIIGLLLLSGNWVCTLFLIVSYLLIATINYNLIKKVTHLNLSRFITSLNFEWIAGFRKNVILFIVIYIIALILSFVNIVSLLLLLLLTTIIGSVYNECETLETISSPELGARHFLNKKLETHLKLYGILILPIIVLYCCLNPATLTFAILFACGGAINIAFFITTKYMLYIPQTKLRANAVYHGLALAGIIFVFLLPIPILLFFRNYKRALLNLNSYLHDYN